MRRQLNPGAKTVSKTVVVGLLATAFLATALPAHAQQPTKVPRIGYLASADPARDSTRAEGIRQGLSELGYIEGQNIAIEYRYAEGKVDQYSALAAEIVRVKGQ